MQNFINPLLEKLATEKIAKLFEISDFIDTICASSFYTTITTPTRITATSKTLTGNIFYNTFTKITLAGNIATSVSDHLTHI